MKLEMHKRFGIVDLFVFWQNSWSCDVSIASLHFTDTCKLQTPLGRSSRMGRPSPSVDVQHRRLS